MKAALALLVLLSTAPIEAAALLVYEPFDYGSGVLDGQTATGQNLVGAYTGSIVPPGFELQVVTAVVLGGASLSGGRGGIAGTIIAVLIVGVLANGLIQLGVPSFWIEVANGVLLLAAVGFDQLRIRLTRSVA